MKASLSILASVLLQSVYAGQVVLKANAPATRLNHAITPAFSTFVEGFIAENHILGLSLGVVYRDGSSTEYGVWGNRTEDGDKVSPEVCLKESNSWLSACSHMLTDTFRDWFMFKGLPISRVRYSDG